MPRLEKELKGARLFVKRDDLTGVAFGGNKIRHLQYLMTEAKKIHADYVITSSGIQSNWARQTVGMAAKMGMKALLVLRTAQFKGPPRTYDGNLLLDHIMGADVKFVKMKINEDPQERLESEADALRAKGHTPLVLGLDAWISPLATLGYVDAFEEVSTQAAGAGVDIDAVVVATGAGTTHAGLALGAKIHRVKTRVVGVNVGAYETKWLKEVMTKSADDTSKMIGADATLKANEIDVRDDYAGRDYGIPTKASNDAVRLAARTEALVLDPVYTSKAMAGLVDLVRRGEFKRDDNVCFVHTGGIPALFAYKEHFQPDR